MTTTSQAVTQSWQAVGRWMGGTVSATAVRHDAQGIAFALAASRAGALRWRSDDPCWRLTTHGLSDPSVVAVEFGGGVSAAAVAWAATASGRLFRSEDNGASWAETSAWAGLGIGTVLAASPPFDEDATLFVGTPAGIFRTLDGGASWENCDFGLLDNDALCLVCAPDFAASQLVWAGTAGGGLYRSRNGGRAWRESGVGLADAPVQSLAASPYCAEDQTLYAALEGAGVYRSVDGGASWSPWSDGLGDAQINALACTGDGVVWASSDLGVHRRAAGADKWEVQATLTEPVLTLVAAEHGLMVAGMYLGGPAVSRDGGAHWETADLPLRTPPLVARATSNTWLAADGDGALALTEDGGATWHAVASPVASALYAVAGGNRPGDRVRFWAATAEGLYGWEPGDDEWQPVDSDLAEQSVFGIDVAPNHDGTMRVLATTADSGLCASDDGGATWRDVTGPWRGQAVLRAELGRSARELVALHVLTARANEAGHFVVELWESGDGGEQWQSLAELTTGIPAVLTAWPEQSVYFLATQHRIIRLSRRDGELALHQYLFGEQTRITALVASPDYAGDGRLFAATSDGLARSCDRGETWTLTAELPDGLPVVWLALEGDDLVAVTLGGAVWRMTAA